MDDEQATLMLYGRILQELMEYERFNEFVQLNYQIHSMLNKEEKRVEVKVIEEDSIHVQQRIAEKMQEKVKENQGQVVAVTADVLEKLKNS